MNEQMDGWIDEWMNEQMDGWVDEWMNKWMDGQCRDMQYADNSSKRRMDVFRNMMLKKNYNKSIKLNTRTLLNIYTHSN